MKFENNIPTILGQYRKQSGLTGKEVVALLQERGIELSEKTLLGYENGVGTPKVNTFMALCDIYHISNIMGEFGYSTTFSLATDENEWSYDLYNDFFNATLLEKIYILLREGVPSFAGYEDQLEQCFPPNAIAANFDRLYKLFMALDESGQGYALAKMEDIVMQRYPNLTEHDVFLISASSEQDRTDPKIEAQVTDLRNRLILEKKAAATSSQSNVDKTGTAKNNPA